MDVLDPRTAATATDLQALTELAACGPEQRGLEACFELGLESLPSGVSVGVAAGLDQAVEYLRALEITEADLRFVRNLFVFKGLPDEHWEWLAKLRFTGSLWAVPEATPVFAGEPLLRLRAPLAEALLVRSYLRSVIGHQTLVASRCARLAACAPGIKLVEDHGGRHAGPATALLTARAAYLAGAAGSTWAEAGQQLGIPVYWAVSSEFALGLEDRMAGHAALASRLGRGLLLPLDEADPLADLETALEAGIEPLYLQLAPGSLAQLPRLRARLGEAGLERARLLLAGGLDEQQLRAHVSEPGHVDICMLRSGLDRGELELGWRLVELGSRTIARGDGRGGVKQVWRRFDSNGLIERDLVGLEGDPGRHGAPLLAPVLDRGKLAYAKPGLESIRSWRMRALASVPSERLLADQPWQPLESSEALAAQAANDGERSNAGAR